MSPEDLSPADREIAQLKMTQLYVVRHSPARGVRRITDRIPPDVCRNGTRWGYIKRAKVIGPRGWGKPGRV